MNFTIEKIYKKIYKKNIKKKMKNNKQVKKKERKKEDIDSYNIIFKSSYIKQMNFIPCI